MARYVSNMGTRAVEQGPIGRAVAENVGAVRKRRGWSQSTLSAKLGELGRPILTSGVAKIEAGDRRVDVDDLLALAAALNVSPARLLLPDGSEDDLVSVTENLTRPAWSVWQWAEGLYALPQADGSIDDAADLALHDLRPAWQRREWSHPLSVAVRRLTANSRRVVRHALRPDRKSAALKRCVENCLADVRRVQDELQQTTQGADRG